MKTEWVAVMKEARERLAVLEYANLHGNKGAARRFGFDRKTVRHWRQRWQAQGIRGLIPRYPKRRARPVGEKICDLVRHARLDFGYGTTRTQLWLWRVHRLRVLQSTIQRLVRDLALPKIRPVRKRRPRQLRLFECDHPGLRPGRREVRARQRATALPVHRDR